MKFRVIFAWRSVGDFVSFPWLKRPGRKPTYSPPSSAKSQNDRSSVLTPPIRSYTFCGRDGELLVLPESVSRTVMAGVVYVTNCSHLTVRYSLCFLSSGCRAVRLKTFLSVGNPIV